MKNLKSYITKDLYILLQENNLLDSLVQRIYLQNELVTVNITEKEIDTCKKKFLTNNNLKPENYDDFIKENHNDEKEFLEDLLKPTILRKYCKLKFENIVESYFLKRKAALDEVVYSLVRVEDHFLANEIYQRIDEKESDFGDLAKEFSQGPEQITRGIVGPIQIQKSHPALEKLLRSTKIGELTPPMKLDNWWVVVRVEWVLNAKLDNVMKNRLYQELLDNFLEQETKEIKKNLQEDLNIDSAIKKANIDQGDLL